MHNYILVMTSYRMEEKHADSFVSSICTRGLTRVFEAKYISTKKDMDIQFGTFDKDEKDNYVDKLEIGKLYVLTGAKSAIKVVAQNVDSFMRYVHCTDYDSHTLAIIECADQYKTMYDIRRNISYDPMRCSKLFNQKYDYPRLFNKLLDSMHDTLSKTNKKARVAFCEELNNVSTVELSEHKKLHDTKPVALITMIKPKQDSKKQNGKNTQNKSKNEAVGFIKSTSKEKEIER